MAPLASARAGNIPAEEAADVPITGTPTQAAERFAAYADAGRDAPRQICRLRQ